MSDKIDVLVEGRLVAGHPMNRNQKRDDNGQPKLNTAGQPMMETFFGVAVPKAGVPDWKATPWGALFVQAATSSWTAGEHLRPDFSWKVIDGDSQIPNKSGNRPCDREGYPGHWVIMATTMLTVRCHHVGKWESHEVIQDKNEIKCGDYCRAFFEVRGNKPSQSPGIYVNPSLFELTRPGELIQTGGPSAAAVFGGAAPVQQVAPPAPVQQVAPPAPVAQPLEPATTFLQPPVMPTPPPTEKSYIYEGNTYTESVLRSQGFTDAHFATMQQA
jgi:hypothetical protein